MNGQVCEVINGRNVIGYKLYLNKKKAIYLPDDLDLIGVYDNKEDAEKAFNMLDVCLLAKGGIVRGGITLKPVYQEVE